MLVLKKKKEREHAGFLETGRKKYWTWAWPYMGEPAEGWRELLGRGNEALTHFVRSNTMYENQISRHLLDTSRYSVGDLFLSLVLS